MGSENESAPTVYAVAIIEAASVVVVLVLPVLSSVFPWRPRVLVQVLVLVVDSVVVVHMQ